MPELPDVEVFKQYFDATALHQPVGAVPVIDEGMLGAVLAAELESTLRGRTFERTARHGKWLFARTSAGAWLVLHFAMTGFLKYFKRPEQEPSHVRLLVAFENGYRLAYDARRRLGTIDLVGEPEELIRDRQLGPDPLDEAFNCRRFQALLEHRRGMIKPALMDQQLLAGLGNVYADEILFQAGVHPRRKVSELDEGQRRELHRCLQRVIRQAVAARADPGELPPGYLIPHRREAGSCPRCRRPLERLRVSGRTAYMCTECQT